MINRFLLIVILGIGWVFCDAQSIPKWVKHRPESKNGTYYYRVTIGEGNTYNMAYSDAFAKAILESSWKIGVQVTTTDDLEILKNNIHDNITIGTVESNIPINKVCEFVEQLSSTKYRVYCLWQIGVPSKVVSFDEFYNCD